VALLKKLEQLFLSHACGGQKVVANFFNKPLERISILEKKRHIAQFKKLLITFVALHRNRC
jgi:hypothetical protein